MPTALPPLASRPARRDPTAVSRRHRSRSGALTAQPGVVCRSQPGRDRTRRIDLSPSHHIVGEADPDQVIPLACCTARPSQPVPAVSKRHWTARWTNPKAVVSTTNRSRAGAGDFARATRFGGVVRMRPPAPDPAVFDAAFRAAGISRTRGVVDVCATSPRHRPAPTERVGQRWPRLRPRQTRALGQPRSSACWTAGAAAPGASASHG